MLITRNCANCGKEFTAEARHVRKGDGKYCSRRCSAKMRARPRGTILGRFLRFASGLEDLAGCWPWIGSKNRQGYGKLACVSFGRHKFMAHRVSYLLFVGPIPRGLQVLHHCDNPSCVNPQHLFVGTQKDNMADCHRKGRERKAASGEQCSWAKLTWDDVFKIRQLYAEERITQEALAKAFGISPSQVRNIVKGISWKVRPEQGVHHEPRNDT